MLESKRRAIIFISISLLLAVAAGFFVLQKVSELNADLGGMTEVYVAADDIPSRTVIKPEQVKAIEIPNRYVNESYVLNVEDLINKVLVVPLKEDEVITQPMIKPVSTATDENSRLVMITQTENVSFDTQLEALDRVDIIVSHKFDGNPVTESFKKDVKVARILQSDKKFSGIVVEVPFEAAPEIIHMQNYADSMRVLKANVGLEEEVQEVDGEAKEAASVEKEEKVDEAPANEEKKEEPKEKEEKKEEKSDKKTDYKVCQK